MEFIFEPEFWVAVSFFLFVGLALYLGVHKKLATALDARDRYWRVIVVLGGIVPRLRPVFAGPWASGIWLSTSRTRAPLRRIEPGT